MCIVQQLYLLLGKSKVVFSLAENILTQAESWPNHLVLDKSYFQLVFNRYHSLVKSILGEQTLP